MQAARPDPKLEDLVAHTLGGCRHQLNRGGWNVRGSDSSQGLAWAAVLGRVMSSAMFGPIALEPLTFAGIGVLVAIVSPIAAYVPARRSLQLDPATILRMQ